MPPKGGTRGGKEAQKSPTKVAKSPTKKAPAGKHKSGAYTASASHKLWRATWKQFKKELFEFRVARSTDDRRPELQDLALQFFGAFLGVAHDKWATDVFLFWDVVSDCLYDIPGVGTKAQKKMVQDLLVHVSITKHPQFWDYQEFETEKECDEYYDMTDDKVQQC